MVDLSIVIVSWNTRELLRDCLQSVSAEPTGLQLQIFVADNASTDGSAEMVRTSFPDVIVIENKENLGFAAANNRVFPLCYAKLILLLNSDTIVKGDALCVMVNFLRENKNVGVVGPKLLHPRARLSVLGCGKQPTLQTTFNHYFFLARLLPKIYFFEGIHHYVGAHDREPRAVGWVSGACLMVRKEVVDLVGGLSERWFMYGEDVEWCARIITAGWKVFHVPAALVEHHLSASTDLNRAASLMPITAARELFVQVNRPSKFQLFLFDMIRVCGLAMRALGYFMRGCFTHANGSIWRAKSQTYYRYACAAAGYTMPADASPR